MLDQIASITIHAGEAHVFVPSQRDPARWYTVRMTLDPQWGWVALACQCDACLKAPERWARALSERKLPCGHTREAKLLLGHREIQGRRWGAQLRLQLEARGWTRAQIDREVWRLHRVCGRDVYATSFALSREYGLYTLEEALDAEAGRPPTAAPPPPPSYPLEKKEEKKKELALTPLAQIAGEAGVSEEAALAACRQRGWAVHEREGVGLCVLSVYAYRLREGLILDAWKGSGAPTREAYLREVQDRRVSRRAA